MDPCGLSKSGSKGEILREAWMDKRCIKKGACGWFKRVVGDCKMMNGLDGGISFKHLTIKEW